MYFCNVYRIEIDIKNIFYDLFVYIIKIINVDDLYKFIMCLKFLIYFIE